MKSPPLAGMNRLSDNPDIDDFTQESKSHLDWHILTNKKSLDEIRIGQINVSPTPNSKILISHLLMLYWMFSRLTSLVIIQITTKVPTSFSEILSDLLIFIFIFVKT